MPVRRIPDVAPEVWARRRSAGAILYFHTVSLTIMTAEEWVWRCAQRLRQRWPSPSIADLEEVAARLWQEQSWRELEPEEAAVRWLRLGALVH